jgi:hypothetical protein
LQDHAPQDALPLPEVGNLCAHIVQVASDKIADPVQELSFEKVSNREPGAKSSMTCLTQP